MVNFVVCQDFGLEFFAKAKPLRPRPKPKSQGLTSLLLLLLVLLLLRGYLISYNLQIGIVLLIFKILKIRDRPIRCEGNLFLFIKKGSTFS